MKKTILIFAAFISSASLVNAQDRRGSENQIPAATTQKIHQESIEIEKKSDEQRNIERQKAARNTSLTDGEIQRMNENQRKEYEAKQNANGSKPQTDNFDNRAVNNQSAPVQQTKQNEMLTPDQRLELERKNNANKKTQVQSTNHEGVKNKNQSKPTHQAPVTVEQTNSKSESSPQETMTPEQRAAFEQRAQLEREAASKQGNRK